jgi:hypothetical protein
LLTLNDFTTTTTFTLNDFTTTTTMFSEQQRNFSSLISFRDNSSDERLSDLFDDIGSNSTNQRFTEEKKMFQGQNVSSQVHITYLLKTFLGEKSFSVICQRVE